MAKRPFGQVEHEAALYTEEYLPAGQEAQVLLPPEPPSGARIRTLAWQKVALWLLPDEESAELDQPKARPFE
jgi:hypothetical protein